MFGNVAAILKTMQLKVQNWQNFMAPFRIWSSAMAGIVWNCTAFYVKSFSAFYMFLHAVFTYSVHSFDSNVTKCSQQKPQPSTTTFVLNQLNQLPSLGTIVVTKPASGSTGRQTITVTKVVHARGMSPSAAVATASSPVCSVVPPGRDQVKLKDLLRPGALKTSSLGELMKLKPPADIAPPVATATAASTSEWGCLCVCVFGV